MLKYDWVDVKVADTSSIMSNEDTLRDVDITVDDPLEWSVHPSPEEKRKCNSFDDYMVPYYGCLFTRV